MTLKELLEKNARILAERERKEKEKKQEELSKKKRSTKKVTKEDQVTESEKEKEPDGLKGHKPDNREYLVVGENAA